MRVRVLQHFFNRCGPDSVPEMQAEGAEAVFGDFTDQMFDYDTRNYDFQVKHAIDYDT